MALLFSSAEVSATHIIGGQIAYKLIGDRTVEFTFIGYRDSEGVIFGEGIFDFGDGTFYGDDEEETFDWQLETIESGIELWEFKILHTYSGYAGYTVSYTEEFRTAEINNFTGSVNTPFYIDAYLALDPFFTNSSPRSAFPPGFTAYSGHEFNSSLAMVDEDGDSLRYSFVIPRQEKDVNVPDYLFPFHPSFYEVDQKRRMSIDPISGILIWDAPGREGEYLITVQVEEWRDINTEKILIGSTSVDYIIQVKDEDPPLFWTVPQTTCQVSGEDYESQIVLDNSLEHEIGIQINTDIEGITFNGFTATEWNTEFGDFIATGPQLIINVLLPAEETTNLEGLGVVNFDIKVIANGVTERFPIGFGLGFDCSLEEIVLGESPLIEEPEIRIFSNKVHVIDDTNQNLELSIFDSSGKLLLASRLPNSSKETMINYAFKKESIYIIVLRGTNQVSTQKFILTN